jgi:hypothetical protein
LSEPAPRSSVRSVAAQLGAVCSSALAAVAARQGAVCLSALTAVAAQLGAVCLSAAWVVVSTWTQSAIPLPVWAMD